MAKKTDGPDVSRHLFGGVLESDASGHYPGLELLNLVFNGQDEDLLPPEGTTFKRRAHDFARMLVWSNEFSSHPERTNVLFDDDTENAIKHLLACLQLEIPGLRKQPKWFRAHFFPYTRSFIHWDARKRGKRISLERIYLRGGGALAYRVLREDPVSERRIAAIAGFEALFPKHTATPLEQLAQVLAHHGKEDDDWTVVDEIENKSVSRNDKVEDLYRDGIKTILGHVELSSVSRIRAVICWTGFWLVTLQHTRAFEELKRDRAPIICDCGAGHPQLRRASQKSLKEFESIILAAVDSVTEDLKGKDYRLPNKQRNSIKGFGTSTATTVKLLNSRTGRRHFTLKLNLLETLVLASIPKADEQPFEWFVSDWLYDRCGIVIGRRGAESAGLLEMLDASIFEDNEAALQKQLAAAGLLTEYSDATKMVSVGGRA